MLTLKNLTIKNFLSTGNVAQSISFTNNDLTLILGENLDLGGNGSRNGVGKCVGTNTVVRVRNSVTGNISEITIGDLYNATKVNKK